MLDSVSPSPCTDHLLSLPPCSPGGLAKAGRSRPSGSETCGGPSVSEAGRLDFHPLLHRPPAALGTQCGFHLRSATYQRGCLGARSNFFEALTPPGVSGKSTSGARGAALGGDESGTRQKPSQWCNCSCHLIARSPPASPPSSLACYLVFSPDQEMPLKSPLLCPRARLKGKDRGAHGGSDAGCGRAQGPHLSTYQPQAITCIRGRPSQPRHQ